MATEHQEKSGLKLQSLRWLRYVFYLANAYIRVLSLADGKTPDRSVLWHNWKNSIERLPMKTAPKNHPADQHGSLYIHPHSVLLSLIIFNYVYLLCLYACGHVHAMAHIGRSEANLWESVLSFHHVVSMVWILVVRIGSTPSACRVFLPATVVEFAQDEQGPGLHPQHWKENRSQVHTQAHLSFCCPCLSHSKTVRCDGHTFNPNPEEAEVVDLCEFEAIMFHTEVLVQPRE